MEGRATARTASLRPAAVYAIAPERGFVDALAAGILARAKDDPAALSRLLVLLPTRRACRALQEAFLRQRGGRSLLLPRMRPLGDVDEDELALAGGEELPAELQAGLPPAIGPLDRTLLLARLVMAHGGVGANPAMAVRLAVSLADLLDGAAIAEVPLDRLDGLVPEEFATHWQITLDFLHILREHWPRLLAERGELDPMERRLRLMRALAAHWQAEPPAHEVIAAGSTGSIPATGDLLAVVARLSGGAVVLPGLDREIDEDSWAAIGEDASHPQHGLHGLLARIGVTRAEVHDWPEAPGGGGARARLIAEALRPAATTGRWLDRAPAPDAAFEGLSRVEAATPREEAGAIAVLMREAAETPGRTAALITPDRALARRVAAELRRWAIEVDDSAGQPLATAAPAAFLRLLADAAVEQLAPVALLAVLKHPLAAGGLQPGVFRERARRLERAVLRGPRPGPGFRGLRTALKQGEKDAALGTWLDDLERRLSPLLARAPGTAVPLAELLRGHAEAAEALAESDAESGAERLWAGEAGESAAGFMAELAAAAEGWTSVDPADYPPLLDALMAGRVVRPRFGRHPRLHIWGPLEARLQLADVMILGGLNEGTWPPEPADDPWLSRPMRKTLGLPPPEFRTGLSAHDFAQACAAPRIVLSRAGKVDGTPTVPSRWLLRLDALLEGDRRWQDAAAPGPLVWHRLLDEPPARPRAAAPPRPCPPVAARPRALSVTAIETWIRDPYAIFGRRILKLRRLDPLDADPGVLERGRMIHDALDRFLTDHGDALPDDALKQLTAYGLEAFRPWLDRPAVGAFWWPRFLRIAEWFLACERDRRAHGYRPLKTEIEGQLEIAGPAGPFLLNCRADRIDIAPRGSLSLLDYKTGVVPSHKQVAAGLSPQLPLEAAIARQGGFPGIPAAEIGELVYVKLSGGREPGKWCPVEVKSDARTVVPPGELAAAALDSLTRRIAQFDDEKTPYLSRPRPQWLKYDGDYDHLARVREWSAAFGQDES